MNKMYNKEGREIKYSKEELLSFSDDKISNAAKTQSSAIQFGDALLYWREYYLDESDKAHSQGNSSLGYALAEKQKELSRIWRNFISYVEDYQKLGYWD